MLFFRGIRNKYKLINILKKLNLFIITKFIKKKLLPEINKVIN